VIPCALPRKYIDIYLRNYIINAKIINTIVKLKREALDGYLVLHGYLVLSRNLIECRLTNLLHSRNNEELCRKYTEILKSTDRSKYILSNSIEIVHMKGGNEKTM
jgi:hypothetical protein